MDLREPDAAGRRAAAEGREVAARGAQRRRESARSTPTSRAERSRTRSRPRSRPPPANVDIDLDGFETRAVVLPPKSGTYAESAGGKGKLLYRRAPRAGAHEEKSPIVYFDLEAREEKTILDDADGFEVTFDGKKMLVAQKKKFAHRRGEGEAEVRQADEPRRHRGAGRAARRMAADVHGRVPLRARLLLRPGHARRELGRDEGALPDAARRGGDAVGRQLGDRRVPRRAERVAHLSRRRRRGAGAERSVGMLGVDWELANGAYRIARIVRGGPWDTGVRSPLDEPGRQRQGGRVRARGQRRAARREGGSVGAASRALGEKTVVLTVNSAPSMTNARQVVVTCLDSEIELRFRAWIEERRQIVDKATGGKVGYIYVQSTGTDAQNEMMRQFMAQWKKEGLVIDERWNSGGQIPDRFIELLHRPIVAYWAVRDGAEPAVAAGGASRCAGDADQRLERIGRRRVSVLLPPGRPRAADRHAHVGRAHRHQRRAVARRRRRRHRADVPDVRPEGRVVRGRPRRRAGHRG